MPKLQRWHFLAKVKNKRANPPDQALLVRQPWINLLLSGEKTSEVRSWSTKIRDRILLAEPRRSVVLGEVRITDVKVLVQFEKGAEFVEKAHMETMNKHIDKHCIPAEKMVSFLALLLKAKTKARSRRLLTSVKKGQRTFVKKEKPLTIYAWEVADPKRYKTPVSFVHPHGAVRFVKIRSVEDERADSGAIVAASAATEAATEAAKEAEAEPAAVVAQGPVDITGTRLITTSTGSTLKYILHQKAGESAFAGEQVDPCESTVTGSIAEAAIEWRTQRGVLCRGTLFEGGKRIEDGRY